MKYSVTGKTSVRNYKKVFGGADVNEKVKPWWITKRKFIYNLTIGEICPSCGQGYIVREEDCPEYKDFVCIQCGLHDFVAEDVNGIF
jgi:hypothetical protein